MTFRFQVLSVWRQLSNFEFCNSAVFGINVVHIFGDIFVEKYGLEKSENNFKFKIFLVYDI